MQLLVDADACPRPVKTILYRVADKRSIQLTLVANQWLTVPESPNIKFLPVKPGFDVADHKIVELVQPNDLVITADIPLADEVVKKGAFGLNPRGELYTPENIGQHRATRDFMATFRDIGIETSGPAPYTDRDKQQFANQLDRYLTKTLTTSQS